LYSYTGKEVDLVMASRSVGAAEARVSSFTSLEEEMCRGRCIHPEHVRAVRQNLLSTDKATRIANLFAVLSDPTRLQVVYALLCAPAGELCVCDLAIGLGRDDTTISHQLRVLRNQQVVATRKVGRVVYYRLTDEHIRLLFELGMTHATETSTKREIEVPA